MLRILLNGIEIKEEIQKSLFMNKSNNLNAVKEAGNGFRLIFCEEIPGIHNEDIGIISVRGKGGSKFMFTLPLSPV